MARPPGVPHKRSFLAIYELDRLGIEPIQMLFECYNEAMKKYKALQIDGDDQESDHEYSKNSRKAPMIDTGHNYLNAAIAAASKLASYKYPTLSALAIKDMADLEKAKDAKPLTTADAIRIIKSDPFMAKEMSIEPKETPNELPMGLNKPNDP